MNIIRTQNIHKIWRSSKDITKLKQLEIERGRKKEKTYILKCMIKNIII